AKTITAKAQKASAKATSKHCSKHWSVKRKQEQICKGRTDNAVLSKTWRNSEKTSHLVPSQRCYADLHRRRHRPRARLHHARIRRSLFDQVSPPSTYSRAQR